MSCQASVDPPRADIEVLRACVSSEFSRPFVPTPGAGPRDLGSLGRREHHKLLQVTSHCLSLPRTPKIKVLPFLHGHFASLSLSPNLHATLFLSLKQHHAAFLISSKIELWYGSNGCWEINPEGVRFATPAGCGGTHWASRLLGETNKGVGSSRVASASASAS